MERSYYLKKSFGEIETIRFLPFPAADPQMLTELWLRLNIMLKHMGLRGPPWRRNGPCLQKTKAYEKDSYPLILMRHQNRISR